MLAHSPAFSGFAVDDVEAARAFYGDTLGLEVTVEHGLLTIMLNGDRPTLAYPKPGHVPAEFTILNFKVEDIDAAVVWLGERGVTLERYEGMGQDADGVMRRGGPYIAWFRDPAGNILAVLQDRPQ